MGHSLRLYDKNGWLDMKNIVHTLQRHKISTLFVVAARGTGKTYGATSLVMEEYNGRMLYVRRTGPEIDMITDPEYNPFDKYNRSTGHNLFVERTGKYTAHLKDGDEIIGKVSSLKDMAKRGISGEDVDVILYDEFIPEAHVLRFKGEGKAFLNMIETIGRNRELEGRPPVMVIALGNADAIRNPLFEDLNLTSMMSEMIRKGKEYSINYERAVAIVRPMKSPISEKKKSTSLYKLAHGTDFYEMAIENNFVDYTERCIKSRDLRAYRPLVSVGQITIYRHKGERRYYATHHRSGSAEQFGTSKAELMAFRRQYVDVLDAHLSGRVEFEEFDVKTRLEEYYGF